MPSGFAFGLGIAFGLSVLAYVLHRFPVKVTFDLNLNHRSEEVGKDDGNAWLEQRRQARLTEKS